MNLDHIGIAVVDLDDINQLMARLLGREHYKVEAVEGQGVLTSFFTAGSSGEAKVELVASTCEGNSIDKFIQKRGPGMHHMAFKTEDIQAELDRLTEEGFEVLPGYPSPGADNMLVAFLHPRTTAGVLVEICQSMESPANDAH